MLLFHSLSRYCGLIEWLGWSDRYLLHIGRHLGQMLLSGILERRLEYLGIQHQQMKLSRMGACLEIVQMLIQGNLW